MLYVLQICTFILLFCQINFGKRVFVAYDTTDTNAVQIRQQIELDIAKNYEQLVVIDYKNANLPEFQVGNPFGQISIRICDTVYKVNYKTKPGEDPFHLVRFAPANLHYKSARALGVEASVQLLSEGVGLWLGKKKYTYEDNRDVDAHLCYSPQKQKMVYENLGKRRKQYRVGIYSGGKSGS